MWPSGFPGRKGKIRFLAPRARLGLRRRSGVGDELAALGQRDGPAPPSIMDGLVDVLRHWSRNWERPVAVVGMPSRRCPTLVHSVAERIAAVGRLPLVHALTIMGSLRRSAPPRPYAPRTCSTARLAWRGGASRAKCSSSTTPFVRGGPRLRGQLCSPMREQPRCCRSPSIRCRRRRETFRPSSNTSHTSHLAVSTECREPT